MKQILITDNSESLILLAFLSLSNEDKNILIEKLIESIKEIPESNKSTWNRNLKKYIKMTIDESKFSLQQSNQRAQSGSKSLIIDHNTCNNAVYLTPNFSRYNFMCNNNSHNQNQNMSYYFSTQFPLYDNTFHVKMYDPNLYCPNNVNYINGNNRIGNSFYHKGQFS